MTRAFFFFFIIIIIMAEENIGSDISRDAVTKFHATSNPVLNVERSTNAASYLAYELHEDRSRKSNALYFFFFAASPISHLVTSFFEHRLHKQLRKGDAQLRLSLGTPCEIDVAR